MSTATVKSVRVDENEGPQVGGSSILPFTIEADLPRNGQLLIQCIPGKPKLRSAFDGAKPAKRGGAGPDAEDPVVPTTQNAFFGDHPRLPGQRIRVNPEQLAYEITDPMYGNEEMCAKLGRWLEAKGVYSGSKTKRDGDKPKSGKLSVHRMKTLCRELLCVLNNGHGKLIDGAKFDLDDVNDLPGHFLLNPGSDVKNGQPTFEKDLDMWVDRLNSVGGG